MVTTVCRLHIDGGNFRIDCRAIQTGMAEQQLDRTNIGTSTQQVCCTGVAQLVIDLVGVDVIAQLF